MIVYLFGQLVFMIGCIWSATAPSYVMLLIGRMIEGIGVSPCECLPSSSIAEVKIPPQSNYFHNFPANGQIFFLHERAFRLGIYTMLLIGGKNLIPLVSAAIIQSIGWPWVFGIIAIIVAVMFVLTYLFVPETAWDRTPHHEPVSRQPSHTSLKTGDVPQERKETETSASMPVAEEKGASALDGSNAMALPGRVRFAQEDRPSPTPIQSDGPVRHTKSESFLSLGAAGSSLVHLPTTPEVPRVDSHVSLHSLRRPPSLRRLEKQETEFEIPPQDIEPIPSRASVRSVASIVHEPKPVVVEGEEVEYRFRKKTYRELLKIYEGRISRERWWKAALRPFILYAYPAITFVPPIPFPCPRFGCFGIDVGQATMLYSLSVVWLIMMSEVIGQIFENP